MSSDRPISSSSQDIPILPSRSGDFKENVTVQHSNSSTPQPYAGYINELVTAKATVTKWDEIHEQIQEELSKERDRTDHRDQKEKEFKELVLDVKYIEADIQVSEAVLFLLDRRYSFSDTERSKLDEESTQVVVNNFPWQLMDTTAASACFQSLKLRKPYSLKELRDVFTENMKEIEVKQNQITKCKVLAERVLVGLKRRRDACI